MIVYLMKAPHHLAPRIYEGGAPKGRGEFMQISGKLPQSPPVGGASPLASAGAKASI